jgi:hydroxymethylbilane synthase
VETIVVRTTGDRLQEAPNVRAPSVGIFTRELEEALRHGRVDLVVHSLKDLPVEARPGLVLAAILGREDPREALLGPPGLTLETLPDRARVGTSSLRRRAQLLAANPRLDVRDLRGNLPTRIEKLDRGDYDAIVLALAGLRRLDLVGRVTEVLEPSRMLPAAGQGALAIQAREGDARIAEFVSPLDHAPTRFATTAERALLERLQGGCQVPIGVLAGFDGATLRVEAIVAALQGQAHVRGRVESPVGRETDAAALGVRLAESLLAQGAETILAELRTAVAERAVTAGVWEEA